jgi:hypothetical protein
MFCTFISNFIEMGITVQKLWHFVFSNFSMGIPINPIKFGVFGGL